MRALLALAAAPLLLSASDGYRFEAAASMAPSPMFVRVTIHPSTGDLRAAARYYNFSARQIATMQAFNRRQGQWCHIHIVDPAVCYRPAIMGHELTHCFWGQWHPEQDRAVRPTLPDRCG